MQARFRIILVFAAVMGLIALVALYRRATAPEVSDVVEAEKPALVRTMELTRTTHDVIETFYGLIKPRAEVNLAFQITGRITQLGATENVILDEGDRVTKGQVIARLDPQRFKASVNQAAAQGEQAKAELASAQARLADAEARVADAKLEADRLAELVKNSAAKQRELEKADLALKVAQAVREQARSQIASASAAYQASNAMLELSQVNLADATLKSPIDGYVAAAPIEVGEMVNPGQTVFTLVDLQAVKLVIGVVERKLPLLAAGDLVDVDVRALTAQAKFDVRQAALADPRKGVVAVIPPAADGVTGLFNVEITLPNDDGLLRPGMIGKASINVRRIEAVVVPATAVIPTEQGVSAFFIDNAGDQPIARRHILNPLMTDRDAYLIEAVPEGASALIVEGQNRLVDGRPVHIVEPTEDPTARGDVDAHQ